MLSRQNEKKAENTAFIVVIVAVAVKVLVLWGLFG